ncbi:hypothetical protein L6R50_27435 [Myxococcota bacterium]|nr:hypothetical protein [Myxococcota bacterium]
MTLPSPAFTWERFFQDTLRTRTHLTLPVTAEVFVIQAMLQADADPTGFPPSVQRLIWRLGTPLRHPALFRRRDGLYDLTPSASDLLLDSAASKVVLASLHLRGPATREAILARAGILCVRVDSIPSEFTVVRDEVTQALQASPRFVAEDDRPRLWWPAPEGPSR